MRRLAVVAVIALSYVLWEQPWLIPYTIVSLASVVLGFVLGFFVRE